MRPLLTAALAVAAGAAVAQDQPPLRPALVATVTTLDHTGAALDPIPPGAPFTIEVAIENRAGDSPPEGLDLWGWLRSISARNLPCHQAARAFFATGGLPTDAVSLNGPVLGVLSEDRALTVVDPSLNLASANLIGATTLSEPPAALVAHSLGGGFAASLPRAGKVVAVTAFDAATRDLVTGLDRPTTLLADDEGGVWVLESGADRARRLDPMGRVTTEVPAVALGGDGTLVLARARDGGLRILDAPTGAELASLPAAPDASAEIVVPGPDGVIAVARLLGGDRLALHYLDAPDAPLEIALAAPAARLAVDPAGRFLFAWDPTGGPVSILDVARGHLAQAIGAEGDAIAEVAGTDRVAFLLRADQSMAAALPLDSIHVGTEPQLRIVPLGAPSARPLTGPGLLLPMAPSGDVLAIHVESHTGFILDESMMLGDTPPMASVSLRGGVPRMATVLDRSFTEVAPGRFRTGAILPASGGYELVLSTGVGGLTLCQPLPTVPSAEPATGPGRMVAELGDPHAPDGTRTVTIRFQDGKDRPLRGLDGTLSFVSLETGWTRRVPLAGAGDGLSLDLPPLGPFVATLSGPQAADILTLVIEVRP